MKRYLALALFCWLFTVPHALATDLTVKSIDIAAVGYINEPFAFNVTIGNIREYPAETYRVTLTVTDKFNRFCYGDTLNDVNLPANSERQHTFTAWTTQWPGEYKATVRVAYPGDVNPSNDVSSKNFTLIQRTIDLMDRNEAMVEFLKYFGARFPEYESFQTHLMQAMTAAGTVITTPAPKPASATPFDTVAKLLEDSWVAYFNTDKDARYGHNAEVAVMNAKDSTIKSYPVRDVVTVGGTPLGADPFNTSTLIAGTTPQVTNGPTNSITTQAQGPRPQDSVIVILVSGKPKNEKEGRGFQQDVEFMDLNLRLERDGPRLPQSVIRKLDNPSPADILGMLDTLKGKYNRIIFFYSGHGDSVTQTGRDLGWMSTRDSALAYWRLFQGLYETGAKDLEIIIDACYSGTAMAYVDYDERYKDRNITLITAASPGRVSYTNYYAPETTDTVGVGAFTFSFVQAFGNPNAESDGAAGTSFVEAFQWTRMYGTDHRGRWLDTLLDPRIYVHRAQTKKDSATSAGTGVSITPTAPVSESDTLRVTLHAESPTVLSIDTTATYLSTGRYWSIDNKGLKADYHFYVSRLWDTVPPDKGPTVLLRGESDPSWTAYDSVKYTGSSNSIIAYGVDFTAQWAIGVAAEGQAGVMHVIQSNPVVLLTPNPAQRYLTLSFELEVPNDVAITLLDVTGRSIAGLSQTRGSVGHNSVSAVLPPLAPGAYLVRLHIGAHEQLLKLQIQ